MTDNKRIALSSDHAAIALRQAIAAHLAGRGFEVVDIGPTTSESTHYPRTEKPPRDWSPRAIAGWASSCAEPVRAS